MNTPKLLRTYLIAASAAVALASATLTPQAAAAPVAGIEATIDAPNPVSLRPGGDPLGFTVTLTNTSSADISGVGLVVSMGHCSCEPSGARMMPTGAMSMLDPQSGMWVSAPYVREGTGTDYLGQTIVPPFVLKQGASNKYEFQVRLDANPDVTAGTGTIDVTVRTPAESGTTAMLPVTVEP